MSPRRALLLTAAVLLCADARADELEARAYGQCRARLGVDTGFDSPANAVFGENVLEHRQWLTAGVDARIGERYRLELEARGRYRFVERRAPEGEPFLVYNGQRKKAWFEAEPGEAYLGIYFDDFDLVIGQQVFAWGANVAFSPSDKLNPLDLRQSLVLADPADLKLPTFAVSARGELGPLEVTLALVPFFRPHRFAVYGQDEGLLQPALQRATRGVTLDPGVLPDPSLEDDLQPLLLGTSRPQAFPSQTELGLRVLYGDLGPRLGLSYLFVHERLPRVTLPAGIAGPLARSLRDEALSAEEVASLAALTRPTVPGEFPRYHQVAFEGSELFGPVQLDVDLAWSPKRMLYDQALRPMDQQVWTAALGVTDARGTGLIATASALFMAIPGIESGRRLLFIESAGAEARPHTAFLLAYAAVFGGRFFEERLSLELRALADGLFRSAALGPRVGWSINEWLTAGAGAEVWMGPPLWGFGYFRNNDQLFGEVTARF